jgi:hypothetical protein
MVDAIKTQPGTNPAGSALFCTVTGVPFASDTA